jgi:hypothetical protein
MLERIYLYSERRHHPNCIYVVTNKLSQGVLKAMANLSVPHGFFEEIRMGVRRDHIVLSVRIKDHSLYYHFKLTES